MPKNDRSWTPLRDHDRDDFLGDDLLGGPRAICMVQDATDLYQSTAIVTGTDMRSRPAGFARCLRDVLVKVSGEPRLIQDARVAELGRRADAFVVSFSYVDVMAGIPIHDDQGTDDRPHYLTVHFESAKIDQALADLGEHPWRGERPVVVPVLSMRGFGAPYLLSAETLAEGDQRASFAERAQEFGLTSRIPSEVELARWGAVAGRLPSLPAVTGPNEVVVAGTLEFRKALPVGRDRGACANTGSTTPGASAG